MNLFTQISTLVSKFLSNKPSLTVVTFQPARVAVPVGAGRCTQKGHRPRNKSGACSRCGQYLG